MLKLTTAVHIMQRNYWDVLGIHQISDSSVSLGDSDHLFVLLNDKSLGRHNFTPIKYLPLGLNICKAYRKGISDSFTQTNQIKNFHELLFMYMSYLGFEMHRCTHWYKLLITANNHAYSYHGMKYIDMSGQSAFQNLSDALKHFKKHVANTRADTSTSTRIHALRLRNQCYRQLHVHGLVSSHASDYRKVGAAWSNWLTDKLGYAVTVKLTPLLDYAGGTNTPVDTLDDRFMPKLAQDNIQMWLKYINRSYALAFPNTQDPAKLLDKWDGMNYHQRQQYVIDTLANHKGVTCNLNYSYTRKSKQLDRAIKQQKHAEADNRKHAISINRWASHRKHLTSIEQWDAATGYQHPDSEPKCVAVSLDLSNVSEPTVRQHVQAHGVIWAIIAVRATLADSYIIIQRGNKKATTRGSGNIHIQIQIILTTTDRMRFSGIPP